MSRGSILRVLIVGAVLLGLSVAAGASFGSRHAARQIATEPSGRPSRTISPSAPSSASPPVRRPPARIVGSIAFLYADSGASIRGATGRLQRYRVAVEEATGLDVNEFADTVDEVLADPRGWTAAGFRFQRVAADGPAEFTVYLASARTSEAMCATGGLHTEGFTSCRLAGQVIINVDRWLTAIPDYGAPLARYREYVVNHEIGHQLGNGHELCPGPGLPAPVMQQQTYGLKGCVAYAWPFLDGQRYRGPSVR